MPLTLSHDTCRRATSMTAHGSSIQLKYGCQRIDRTRKRRHRCRRCEAGISESSRVGDAGLAQCRAEERRHQLLHFELRRGVRQRWARAERELLEIVDGGQTAREKFAEDDAFGEAVDQTKVELLRQLLQGISHKALVA